MLWLIAAVLCKHTLRSHLRCLLALLQGCFKNNYSSLFVPFMKVISFVYNKCNNMKVKDVDLIHMHASTHTHIQTKAESIYTEIRHAYFIPGQGKQLNETMMLRILMESLNIMSHYQMYKNIFQYSYCWKDCCIAHNCKYWQRVLYRTTLQISWHKKTKQNKLFFLNVNI